jgi:type I restriction enzyme S subunit
MAKTGFIQSLYQGIRQRSSDFRFDVFGSQLLPLPPRSEQDQIVLFLDWKVSLVNQFLEKKSNELDLLKEKIISAVSFAIQKNSKTYRLQNIVSLVEKPVMRNDKETYTTIGMYNRGRGIFHKPIQYGADLGDSTFNYVVENAFALSGQFSWEGAVSLTTKEDIGCIASHRYYLLQSKSKELLTAYLYGYFITQKGHTLLNLNSIGAAGRNRPLNIRTLLKEKIPVPNIKTQSAICDYILQYMEFRKKHQKLEQFLSEYRTRLISDVVTGKVDVRNVRIPEIFAENELNVETEEKEND